MAESTLPLKRKNDKAMMGGISSTVKAEPPVVSKR
jgi:hypothetical protein